MLWFGLSLINNFNSHTREGVTLPCSLKNIYSYNFNSHTREGVTCRSNNTRSRTEISTHTPVRV